MFKFICLTLVTSLLATHAWAAPVYPQDGDSNSEIRSGGGSASPSTSSSLPRGPTTSSLFTSNASTSLQEGSTLDSSDSGIDSQSFRESSSRYKSSESKKKGKEAAGRDQGAETPSSSAEDLHLLTEAQKAAKARHDSERHKAMAAEKAALERQRADYQKERTNALYDSFQAGKKPVGQAKATRKAKKAK